MKFTLSWLKKFLDTEQTVSEIGHCLTLLGLEVEEIIDRRVELNTFEVAHILSIRPHPSANKLQICEVQANEGILQIICGASNARENIKVVLAKIGCEIPQGKIKIKEAVIRGEKSYGILCSEGELLINTNSEGIIELPMSAKVGEPFIKYYGMDDPIFHINITPNRGDALGVYGIARDLAAKGLGKLKELIIPEINEDFYSNFTLNIKDKKAVPLFCIREIKNLQNKESPDWLKQILKNIDIQSISGIEDITNYILYSFGQPIHAYDRDKFLYNIQVELLKKEAKFKALNGKDYKLKEGDLVVKDETDIHSLAGIIGSSNSSCTLNTQNIILESAYFLPTYITKSGRHLQIDTEARYRFERNIDQSFTMEALNIAVSMIKTICGGEVSQLIYEGEGTPGRKVLEFPLNCLTKITGMNFNLLEVWEILKSIGFVIHPDSEEWLKASVVHKLPNVSNNILKIFVPPWRHDINIKEDLIEEIVRIYGYDKLAPIKLPEALFQQTISKEQRRVSDLKRVLANCGYDEVVTNSFMCSETAKLFTNVKEELFLLNPLNIENNYMRPSIIPNLLRIAQKNLVRSIKDIAVMEVGPIFNSWTRDGELLFASGIKCGQYNGKNCHTEARLFDVFDIKADVEVALNFMNLSIEKCQFTNIDLPYYHPTRSCRVKLAKNIVAYFGQIHPSITKYFEIKEEVFAFEINIANIPFAKPKFGRRNEFIVSDFQPTFRDYAFTIEERQPVGEILNCIKSLDKKIIKSIDLFDSYSGPKVPPGKKSIAFKVQLQADNRTLDESELCQLSEVIISTIREKLQGQLREN